MVRIVRILAGLGGVALLGAATVIGLGLYDTSAKKDHLPGVATLLHTVYLQSIRARAPDESEVPADLGDADRVELGAWHFQTACAFCHAAPGQPQSVTVASMNPGPPTVQATVEPWEARHLFWIVREGVKMTGMPHWPADQRDDEVWSMVAYLEAVRQMRAEVKPIIPGKKSGPATCTACHGEDGRSENSFIPRLDILTGGQISDALRQYRSGRRASGFMREVASRLTDAEIDDIAKEFGNDAPAIAIVPSGEAGEGQRLATQGTDDVPACTACHGPGREADAPIAPVIAGQSRIYIATQLKLWREGTRGGGARRELMEKAARYLSDDDIAALADWFASLESGRSPD